LTHRQTEKERSGIRRVKGLRIWKRETGRGKGMKERRKGTKAEWRAVEQEQRGRKKQRQEKKK